VYQSSGSGKVHIGKETTDRLVPGLPEEAVEAFESLADGMVDRIPQCNGDNDEVYRDSVIPSSVSHQGTEYISALVPASRFALRSMSA
jgi:hypothetical protein